MKMVWISNLADTNLESEDLLEGGASLLEVAAGLLEGAGLLGEGLLGKLGEGLLDSLASISLTFSCIFLYSSCILIKDLGYCFTHQWP